MIPDCQNSNNDNNLVFVPFDIDCCEELSSWTAFTDLQKKKPVIILGKKIFKCSPTGLTHQNSFLFS